MMQIHHTPNGKTNKIAFVLFLLTGSYAIFVFATSCNSSRHYKANEAYLIKQDSAVGKDSAKVVKTDSTSNEENHTLHYQTGDSALDSEMEIVMQQQKDYANGDTINRFPTRPVYTPVVIEKQGDKVTVDAGGREIKSITVKDKKQSRKTDSLVTKSVSQATHSVYDSTKTKDTMSKADSIVSTKVVITKQTKRFPTSLAVAGGVVLLLVCAFVILKGYYKRRSKIAQAAMDAIAKSQPENGE